MKKISAIVSQVFSTYTILLCIFLGIPLLLVLLVPLGFITTWTGPLAYVVPIRWQLSRHLLHVEQRRVTPAELASWPEYSDPDVGLTVKYPAHLFRRRGGFSSTNAQTVEEPYWQNDSHRSQHFTTVPPEVEDKVYFGQSDNDRFVVRVDNKPFTLDAVTGIGRLGNLRVWYPKKVTVADKEGYYIPFYGAGCGVEHYAFPSKNGQKIVKLSFIACPQEGENRDKVVPYREAILSSVRWVQ